MNIFTDYFYTLIQSAALELITYLAVLPFFIKSEHRRKIVLMVLPINAITHPLFFFFIMGLPINFLANILIGEIVVTIAEAFFLLRIFSLTAPKALALSAIVNFISWQFGPILTFWVKS